MNVFLFFYVVNFHCPVLEEILARYNRIENNEPKFSETYLWKDLIYLYDNSEVREDIISIMTDTSRVSAAGMPLCSHLSWAVSDAKSVLTQQRIGAWIGELYPYKRVGLTQIALLPSRYDTVSGTPEGSPYRCGSRWAEFYPFLDSIGVLWLENLNGSMSVNEICRVKNLDRDEFSMFLIDLSKVDALRFSAVRVETDERVLPNGTGEIKGIMYFFIGE